MKVIRRRDGEVDRVVRYAPLETKTEEIMQNARAILRQIDRKAARIRKLALEEDRQDYESWKAVGYWKAF